MKSYRFSLEQMLALWEGGADLHPVDRALLCISEVKPKMNSQSLAELSLGKRNESLLRIYEQNFGPNIEGYSECLGCGEAVEFDLNLTEFDAAYESDSSDNIFEIINRGIRYNFRLLNSFDLASVIGMHQVDKVATELLKLCLLYDHKSSDKVSKEVIRAIEKRMQVLDPLVELMINLKCSNCKYIWNVLFDIEEMLWKSIESAANNILDEIHVLALHYSWSENEIMHMKPARRRAYIKRSEL